MILIEIFVKLILFKLLRKKLILVNEAAGLGDYLWVRNYLEKLKTDPYYKKYKLVLCATRRWLDFAKDMDSKYVDVFLPFNSPHNPKFKNFLPFYLFIFDIFIKFRASSKLYTKITNAARAKIIYTNDIALNKNLFYSNYDKLIVKQLAPPPEYDIQHKIPVVKTIDECYKKDDYCVLNLGGYYEGLLSIEQLVTIVKSINKYFNIKIIINGTDKQKYLSDGVINSFPDSDNIISLCGELCTSQLPDLIKNAKFIITTNTSIWHFSIQLNKPHIVMFKDSPWVYDSMSYPYVDKENINFIPVKECYENLELPELESKMNLYLKKFKQRNL